MISVIVHVKGLKETQAMLNMVGRKAPVMLDKIASKFADETLKIMKRKMKKNYWTGISLETLRKEKAKGGYNITTAADYFKFQELGFRIHLVGGQTPTYSGRKFQDWIKEKYMPLHPELKKVPKALFVSKPASKSHIIVPSMLEAGQKFDKISSEIVRGDLKWHGK